MQGFSGKTKRKVGTYFLAPLNNIIYLDFTDEVKAKKSFSEVYEVTLSVSIIFLHSLENYPVQQERRGFTTLSFMQNYCSSEGRKL